MWEFGSGDLNFFYYKLDEENCFDGLCLGISGSNDANLWGATYDWNFNSLGTAGAYALIGQDMGGFGPVGVEDSKVKTYGARWYRGLKNAAGEHNMFDWNLEFAMQHGGIGQPVAGPGTCLRGWIGEAWFGFGFHAGDRTHGRVHLGALKTSGDKFSSTDENEQFVPLYGDFHANNRFGDLDWVDQFGPQNITDYNVGYEHWFGDMHYCFSILLRVWL